MSKRYLGRVLWISRNTRFGADNDGKNVILPAMSALDSDYKGKSAEFWTGKGDKLTVVGDFLGRLPAVQLLAPKKGEEILDAGCGAGFVSRMVARSGARVC